MRRASTVDGKTPYWPTSDVPTPYEILGIQRTGSINLKELKKKYRQLCKVYHPDLSKNRTLLGRDGQELQTKDKETRFKKISGAYKILSDGKNRDLYDRFKTGWESAPAYSRPGADAFTRRTSPADDRFWQAGNWEDYRNTRNEDPVFKSKLAKKNRDLVILLVAAALLVLTIQVMAALDRVQVDHLQAEKQNKASKDVLLSAYMNHGLGVDKWSRLNHFLWNRRMGLYHNDQESLNRQTAQDRELVSCLQDKSPVASGSLESRDCVP